MIQDIRVDLIIPHPKNPRQDLGDLTELAESIKARGVLQNLTVVPALDGFYRVVIGHRRLEAAMRAGLETVPCVVSDMNEKEQVGTMLLENIQRTDLTVYEQAQGFQMMLDLGETLETISDKTGFSKSTVRRRLKMAELDQEVLKSVSDRQISIMDFDKLAQIENPETRNALLASIGTHNFDREFETARRKQILAQKLPAIKAQLKQLHANKGDKSMNWSGEYETLKTTDITEWEEETPLVPAGIEGKLFYYIDDYYCRCDIYRKRPKAAPEKKSPEELEQAKRIADAHAALSEAASVAYALRSNFISALSLTSKNMDKLLRGAVVACVIHTISYAHCSDTKPIFEMLGVSPDYTQSRLSETLEAVKTAPPNVIPSLIYAAYGDRDGVNYFTDYKSEYPRHKKNAVLDALYDWLISLGYELSDDETAMRDGTHEVFSMDPAKSTA